MDIADRRSRPPLLAGLRGKRLKRIAAGLQYGVLPFQVTPDGSVRIMLLTSRETRRWVIPKGWPMAKRTPQDAAMQEAWEEAGITGRIIGKEPLGSYRYDKRISASIAFSCRVKVFLFAVEQEHDDWPEQAERQRRWVDAMEAAAMVQEKALAKLMLKMGAKLSCMPGSVAPPVFN